MYYTSPIRCITQQLFSPGRERGVCSLKVRTLKRKKTQRLKMISGCRSYKTRYRKHSKRILIQAMLVSRSSLLSALLVLASRMPRTPVVDWSIGRLVDWSIGRLVDWSTGRLVDWSIGRLVDWSIGRLVDWSIGRLVDWSIGRLVDWSIGRLVDWSIGRLVDCFLGCRQLTSEDQQRSPSSSPTGAQTSPNRSVSGTFQTWRSTA